ncbi:DUF1109 family protein [Bradyrhizobium sp. 180]|uniref:NrsF family protein n=1 Tax=Bradyrhizobium sp. 180 TaxID=2782650 RepID=UPI001FF74888|nr:DUF1109 family protein [Bradyrhizobium sp. 180]
MTTEELIRGLAADRMIGPRAGWLLAAALLLGTSLVALIFFSAIGFRQDIAWALGTVRFVLKFVIVVPVAVLAVGGTFRNTTPLSSPGRWGRLLLAPALLLVLSALVELVVVPSSEWLTKAIGSNSVNCMTIIPTLGSVPLVLFIRALRRGAPANPGLSGALAGLAASGIAATFYATNCFDDSPLFVITWYPLATGILVLSGYLAGLRYLRW